MATQKTQTNGTPSAETPKTTATSKTTTTRSRTTTATAEKQSSALSVKEKTSTTAQGIQLITEPGLLPGNRPVEASHLKIVSTYKSVGAARPVAAGDMEISSTLTISGQRPFMVSHLQVSETYTVMGNRPVAPNEIDDPALLMGYLD